MATCRPATNSSKALLPVETRHGIDVLPANHATGVEGFGSIVFEGNGTHRGAHGYGFR